MWARVEISDQHTLALCRIPGEVRATRAGMRDGYALRTERANVHGAHIEDTTMPTRNLRTAYYHEDNVLHCSDDPGASMAKISLHRAPNFAIKGGAR